MNTQRFRHPLLVLTSLILLTFAGRAAAEPPIRAARLGYISGTVSFTPADQSEWEQAVINRPLSNGDRLWVDADSRAELQIGGAVIRVGSTTSITLFNLDDRLAQVQLSQGALKIRIRHIGPEQSFEVDTPNLALTLRHAGEYRIDVDQDGNTTELMVGSGQAEVFAVGRSYSINPQQGYRFYGSSLTVYDVLAPRPEDDLDRWARDRDYRGENSLSSRYVSPDVVGYEDLDANGIWRTDSNYGNVWMPTRVPAGWTPYRDGHWVWVDPWGWTWIDDAPWGYAVSHYGRWANFDGTWAWVPGPPREQAVYAPAQVAFVGGRDFQLSLSVGSTAEAIGWFPLAPHEVYQPSYPVSRRYFDKVNRSNAVIVPTTIANAYSATHVTNNTTIVNSTTIVNKVVYLNQLVPGAIVAVPTQAFVKSQSVAKAAVPISKEVAGSATVFHVDALVPARLSRRSGAPAAGVRAPVREQAFVLRTAPPPAAASFQQRPLAARPGVPIKEVPRQPLEPEVPPAAASTSSAVTSIRAASVSEAPQRPSQTGSFQEARKSDMANVNAAKKSTVRTVTNVATSNNVVAKLAASREDSPNADSAKPELAGVEARRAINARAEAERAAAVKAAARPPLSAQPQHYQDGLEQRVNPTTAASITTVHVPVPKPALDVRSEKYRATERSKAEAEAQKN